MRPGRARQRKRRRSGTSYRNYRGTRSRNVHPGNIHSRNVHPGNIHPRDAPTHDIHPRDTRTPDNQSRDTQPRL
ncbi:MAG: hypothetical protein ACRDRC_11095 [Pseudonocardiaceae bacterium]